MTAAKSSPVWHPFTQAALDPAPIAIARTEGACLETPDGRRIIDGISSWWVVTHGHRHPRIVSAIQEAVARLDQVIFAGFTHEPAEDLARGLVALAPAGQTRDVYSDSGSTAVEVALKMALGTFRNEGKPRRRIVVMEGSYHGDTIGAMSVGARGVFNEAYEPLLFEVDRIPFPAPGRERDTLDALEALTREGHAAALIVEPLVLGAGGMLMYAPEVLADMAKILQASDTLLIADEVMTGWGRTGTLFACEQAGVAPDILCTSKGLTGGTIPLAATLATERVYAAHYATDRTKTFYHSSSYTANPIACAAGLANLGIWRDEPVQARITALASAQAEHLADLARRPGFAHARQCGTIAAIDLEGDAQGYLAGIGPRLRDACLARDVLLRPLGNIVYVMPPYCISQAELDRVYEVLLESIATSAVNTI